MPAPDQVPPGGPEIAAKKDLSSWWKSFKKGGNLKKEEEKGEPPESLGIFGVPLQQSVRYANVAISLSDANGQSYIYGYVPIVVAKCGVFLKEKATDVEGIFRLSGSEKRIKELRAAFNSPDRYGKGLDWTGYTVHDAANILRRYFNQLPEPIIPLDFYDKFREPLRNHQSQAVGHMEGQSPSEGDFDAASVIKLYQQLITELPPLNRQLLLYILDLLAVFASKSDLNKMTTPNLAAIFQPGTLSHPSHDMAPSEYRLSQDVLIFLIENQDNFLIGMQGTAADEKTVQEVESGPPTPQSRSATPRHSKSTVIRSGSNSSKYSGVRRSASASSRRSRNSVAATHSPSGSEFQTPLASPIGTGGVHRSNTLPPSRSSNLTHATFGNAKSADVPEPIKDVENTEAKASTKPVGPPEKKLHTQALLTEVMSPNEEHMMSLPISEPLPGSVKDTAKTTSVEQGNLSRAGNEKLRLPTNTAAGQPADQTSPQATPTASSRGFSNLFGSKSPTLEPRQPKKLQKKRSPFPSAHSSTHSLSEPVVENIPLPTAPVPIIQNSQATPISTPQHEEAPALSSSPLKPPPPIGENLKPSMSPTTSYMSQSDTDGANQDPPYIPLDSKDGGTPESNRKRWFGRKGDAQQTPITTNGQAARSRSSVLSGSDARKSLSIEGRKSVNLDRTQPSGDSADPYAVTSDSERESRRGNPLSWIKGKVKERQEKRDKSREEKRLASPTRGSSLGGTDTQEPNSLDRVVSATAPGPATGQPGSLPPTSEAGLKVPDAGTKLETVKESPSSTETEKAKAEQTTTEEPPATTQRSSIPSRPQSSAANVANSVQSNSTVDVAPGAQSQSQSQSVPPVPPTQPTQSTSYAPADEHKPGVPYSMVAEAEKAIAAAQNKQNPAPHNTTS